MKVKDFCDKKVRPLYEKHISLQSEHDELLEDAGIYESKPLGKCTDVEIREIYRILKAKEPQNSFFYTTAEPLAKRGFLVFPITKNSKFPPHVKFKAESTSDLNKIRQWSQRWSNANVGIHCEDLIVVDVDGHKGGWESLKELDYELPETYTVRTPNGGAHCYYKHKGGVPNGVDVLGPGIDIRSTGGYVLSSGSVVDGKPYEVDNDSPIVQATPELIEACKSKSNSSSLPEQNIHDATEQEINFAEDSGRDYLKRRDPAIEGQGGDLHTLVTACKLKELGIEKDIALELMREWNERCEPPWNDSDLQDKANNAYKYGREKFASKFNKNNFQPIEGAKPSNKQDTEKSSDEYYYDFSKQTKESTHKSRTYFLKDIDRNKILQAEPLIEGVLFEKNYGQIFADENTGKTLMALYWAFCIASGIPCGGKTVSQGGVIYLNFEDNDGVMNRLEGWQELYGDIAKEHGIKNIKRLPIAYRYFEEPLVDDNGITQYGNYHLNAVYKDYRNNFDDPLKIVFADTVRDAIGGSLNDETRIIKLANIARKVVEHWSCSFVQVNHTGHKNKDRPSGSRAIGGKVDMSGLLEADSNGRLTFTTKKQRNGNKGEILCGLIKQVQLGTNSKGQSIATAGVIDNFEIVSATSIPSDLDESLATSMTRIRTAAGKNDSVNRMTAFKYVTHVTKNAFFDQCEKLAEKGYVKVSQVSARKFVIVILDKGMDDLFIDPLADTKIKL